MSETYNFSVKRLDAEGNEILDGRRAEFNSGTLTISIVEVDEQGQEKLTPAMVQPFKTMPDGTRSDFVDAADAFAWVDLVNGIVIT